MSELKEIVARAQRGYLRSIEWDTRVTDLTYDEHQGLVNAALQAIEQAGFVIVPKQKGDTGAMISGGIRRDTSMAPLNAQWLNLKEPKG